MIHDSIRTLPMVTFWDINTTGDIKLLSDDPDTPIEELVAAWEKIIHQDNQKSLNAKGDRVFNINREIQYQSKRFEVIRQSCQALLFDRDQRLINLLIEHGYTVRDEHYISDINRVVRESDGINNRIAQLKKSIPEPTTDTDSNQEFSIIDNMASMSAILSFDFDFYAVSVEKYRSMEKQVKIKIDNTAKQQQLKPKK